MRTIVTFVGIALVALAFPVAAQQPNTPNATLIVNNFEGAANVVADVESPGVLIAKVQGEPGRPYILFLGQPAPTGRPLGPIGLLDLSLQSPITFVVNGLNPSNALLPSFGLYAKLNADAGESIVAAPVPAGMMGAGPALQALVQDPSEPVTGFRLTGASRLNIVPAPPSPSPLSAGPSSSTSISGLSGSLGTLLSEIRAPIDAINGTDVTVLQSLVIGTNMQTSFRDINNNPTTLGAFSAGDFVKIEAFTDPQTGDLVAHQIRAENQFADADVKVEGPVDFVAGNDISLLGVTFTVVPGTDDDVPGGFASLMMGDYIEIEANLVNGAYQATEVDPENPNLGLNNASVRVRAFVDAITTTDITVLGKTIQFGTGTRFDDPLAAISSNSYVEVRAIPDPSGDLFATRIRLRSADNESELKGPVGMLMNPDFTIDCWTVNTNANTDWDFGLTSFTDLSVGLRVEVDGIWNGTSLVAEDVEIDDDD